LLFFLASPVPANSFSATNTNFTPTAFFAKPDEDGYYRPVDRSSDEDIP